MKYFLLLVSLLFLGACTNKEEASKTDGTVVTTVGMIADVARQIAGDHQEIINLIGEGIDPHMHQPSKSEIDKIQKAGLVLYNGLFLEGKMGTILKDRADRGNPVSAVAEGLDIQVIGSKNPDPHLWMDVSIWSKVARKISDELVVDEVIKIFLIFLSFSNFLIIGIILNISPTLAPCIQIVSLVELFLR